jgi:hypothetical protein
VDTGGTRNRLALYRPLRRLRSSTYSFIASFTTTQLMIDAGGKRFGDFYDRFRFPVTFRSTPAPLLVALASRDGHDRRYIREGHTPWRRRDLQGQHKAMYAESIKIYHRIVTSGFCFAKAGYYKIADRGKLSWLHTSPEIDVATVRLFLGDMVAPSRRRRRLSLSSPNRYDFAHIAAGIYSS